MEIRITVSLRWWVMPYLCALMGFAAMTGLQPDVDKATDLIARRGVRFAAA